MIFSSLKQVKCLHLHGKPSSGGMLIDFTKSSSSGICYLSPTSLIPSFEKLIKLKELPIYSFVVLLLKK